MNEKHFAVVDRRPVPAPVTRKTEIVTSLTDSMIASLGRIASAATWPLDQSGSCDTV